MKKNMNLGKTLNRAELKSIVGGTGEEFVVIMCSNGAIVCISCETEEECSRNAEIACAAANGDS